VYSNSKINLGLFITGKRADGFHNLESIFYPVQWNDGLEIEVDPTQIKKVELIEYNGHATLNQAENLCVKAYCLLDANFDLPPVKIHLYKTIPTGAGLGGGSSNASFTLKTLNSQFSLNLSVQQLSEYAMQLGSDCPFFIHNKPAYVTGRGENIQPIELDLSNYYIAIIHPGIHVTTANAFKNIQPKKIDVDLPLKITTHPVNEWQNFLVNDFEKSVFEKHAEIKVLKENMYNHGAHYASMSGSGSAVYGIFDTHSNAQNAIASFSNYKSKLILAKDDLKRFL
jgi:4-diphosphocytidyl-2-C-methyl-D-erythritol kinase